MNLHIFTQNFIQMIQVLRILNSEWKQIVRPIRNPASPCALEGMLPVPIVAISNRRRET